MNRLFRNISIVFAAGCLGGLTNSVVVWLCGKYGITSAIGVKIAPALTAKWLYPRVVWGGIWGALFLLPFHRGSIYKKGLLLSLGPTAAQLFFVFPHMLGKGFMGMKLGPYTPLAVIFFNAIWGIAAAFWIRQARD